MSWPTACLAEVVEFLDSKRRPVRESERVEGPYPYYGANGQQGWIDGFLFNEPLILLAEDGGHFDNPSRGIAYAIDGKSWVNNHAHVLRVRECADFRYLLHSLKNRDVRSYISGSTRAKLTKGGASRIEIPLPPIEEQRRIAAILDRAEELRAKRRAAIAFLDQLPQAIFHEIFGAPESIFSRWRTAKLGAHLTFLTSGSRGWGSHYAARGSVFIRIQNVRNDRLDLTDVAYVTPPATQEAVRTQVKNGDVLLSITADLGRSAVVDHRVVEGFVNQHLAILRPDESIHPRFLSAFIASEVGQRQIQRQNRHGVKAGLNFDDIRSIQVAVPPHNLQERFASLVELTHIAQSANQSALAELDALFAALQNKAFK